MSRFMQPEMKPYFTDEKAVITIYHADARDLLPYLPEIDVVLTDPVYGVEGGNGGQLRDYRKADYKGDWNDDPEYVKTVCVPIIRTCLTLAKTTVLTPGTRCCCAYPQPDEVGGFYQPASNRIGRFGFQNLQPIFYYGRYINDGKGALHTVHVLTESSERNGHPCPKPIKAWTWLLNRIALPREVVLDPFMGSGTTLRAAKDLGHPAIGIDREEWCCEIAARRLSQEVFCF